MIVNGLKSEIAKLRQMTFKEKRQYLWEYYRLQFFVTAMVLFVVGSLINIWFINPPKREYLHFAWLYPPVSVQRLGALEDSLSGIVYDPSREQIVVFSYVVTDNMEANMATQSRLFALIQVGDIDAFFVFGSEIELLASEFLLQPVHEVVAYAAAMNPELYQALEDRLKTVTFTLETTNESTEVTDVMAISVEGSPLMEYLGFDTTDLHIAMLSTASRPYRLAQALEVLLGFDDGDLGDGLDGGLIE